MLLNKKQAVIEIPASVPLQAARAVLTTIAAIAGVLVSVSTASAADVDAVRSMLADAGSRFARHDPSTWPLQARLLERGEWDAFLALE